MAPGLCETELAQLLWRVTVGLARWPPTCLSAEFQVGQAVTSEASGAGEAIAPVDMNK